MSEDSTKPILDISTVEKNPFLQFEKWYGESYKISGEDASAMTLVTASGKQPNARTVYLRGSDKKGFWFFTNYNSRKGNELAKNKNACLLFFWPRLLRQVKMLGHVEKLPAKESDNYFDARPRESQIGAWASPQSKPIPNRETLEAWVDEYTKLFEEKKVSRPKHWGGFRFVPSYFEFWYGRESRLHDRVSFTKQKNGKWKTERLSP
ncbi:MAG: pyridoxamine 5'-phosphate oxidase [Bacteroidetes bacterium]|nr:pyridoxamine 5'-phosphate oxidase [Bacteroidota bacterium]